MSYLHTKVHPSVVAFFPLTYIPQSDAVPLATSVLYNLSLRPAAIITTAKTVDMSVL